MRTGALRRPVATTAPTEVTRPWTGEYTWPATDEQLYEYACHEGNSGMTGILAVVPAK